MTGAAMLTVSCADDAEADRIARMLVESRRAACVQALPVRSTYCWQGALERTEEVLLLVKTSAAAAADAVDAIRAAHSYTTPEILTFRAEAGLDAYVGWIESQVGEVCADSCG